MKSVFLFAAILLGIFLPGAETMSFLIQYLLMMMLFISFLGIKITSKIFSKSIVLILITNIGLAFLWYFIMLPFNQTLAIVGFITAVAPTAMSTPTVVRFLKGKVEYATASVILTNLIIALLLPVFVFVLHIGKPSTFVFTSLQNVAVVIIVPLLVAQGIHYFLPWLGKLISNYKTLPFYAWVMVVFLAVAKSSAFIATHKEIPAFTLISIAFLVLVICAGNFLLGRLIGGKEFGMEGSQSLGQKNTAFTIWYALAFLNPLIALGPVCYLIYHNIYNSYQMIRKDLSS